VPALLGPGRLGCGDGMAGRRGTLYPVRTVSWGGNGITRSEAGAPRNVVSVSSPSVSWICLQSWSRRWSSYHGCSATVTHIDTHAASSCFSQHHTYLHHQLIIHTPLFHLQLNPFPMPDGSPLHTTRWLPLVFHALSILSRHITSKW
jgi:hypothetical protein